jgi:hypothetical protein
MPPFWGRALRPFWGTPYLVVGLAKSAADACRFITIALQYRYNRSFVNDL